MRVLFAIGNAQTSKSIAEQYQVLYNEEIEYKDVFYFKALIEEVKKDKEYDRIVISEELERFPVNSLEEVDKFIFNNIDRVTDEIDASVSKIILICSDRRTKSDTLLSKLYGNGIYSMLLGDDRSVGNLCTIINEPKTKKQAKEYLKIDYNTSVTNMGGESEDTVDEAQIISIIKHYEKLGNDTSKYEESFDRIAEQYNQKQLRVIAACLPLNVKDVLMNSKKYGYLYIGLPVKNDEKPKQNERKNLLSILKWNKAEKRYEDSKKREDVNNVIEEARQQEELKKKFEEIERQKEENARLLEEEKRLKEEEKKQEENELKRKMEEEARQRQEAAGAWRKQREEARRIEDEERDRKQEEERKAMEERRKKEALERDARRREEEAQDKEEEIQVERLAAEKVVQENIEVENNSKQEEEVRQREEAEARRKQEEVRQREEAEARRKQEEARQREEAEARRKQEEEARQREEAEARRKQEEEVRQRKEVESLTRVEREQYSNYKASVYEVPKDYKKVIVLVGANKSGTTFLVNAISNNMAMKQVNTAILDMTKDRGIYYIYNRDEQKLRKIALECMKKLSEGVDSFIPADRFLRVYTAVPGTLEENRKNLKHKTLIETVKRNNNLIVVDADFSTPIEYFEQASEIYVVQDLDILKLQETTMFLRELKNRQVDMSKIKIIINKYVKTALTPKKIVEGLSYYNDPEMSFVDELLNGRVVYSIIPYKLENYANYVEGLYKNNINYKTYTQDFKDAVENLCMQIYPVGRTASTQKTRRSFFG